MCKFELARKRIESMGYIMGEVLIDCDGENGLQIEMLNKDGSEADCIYCFSQ